jgi:hypothetical protein
MMKLVNVGGVSIERLVQIQDMVEIVGFWWLVFGHVSGCITWHYSPWY